MNVKAVIKSTSGQKKAKLIFSLKALANYFEKVLPINCVPQTAIEIMCDT